MNYELAKSLKDARFPQKGKGETRPYQKQITVKLSEDPLVAPVGIQVEAIYLPTLSELIEACGDRFDALIKESETQGEWVATASNGDSDNLVSSTSSTPEEAVARLYLELNKK